jgi:hypothetical protein
MEVLAVIDILLKTASAAGTIAQGSRSLYNHIKKVKNPQELLNDCKGLFGAVDKKFDGISHGIEQLSDKMEHLGHITTRGFDQLSGRVEGLARTTASGIERISEAFSQVICIAVNIYMKKIEIYIQCCGLGSGIRCIFDRRIRNPPRNRFFPDLGYQIPNRLLTIFE